MAMFLAECNRRVFFGSMVLSCDSKVSTTLLLERLDRTQPHTSRCGFMMNALYLNPTHLHPAYMNRDEFVLTVPTLWRADFQR